MTISSQVSRPGRATERLRKLPGGVVDGLPAIVGHLAAGEEPAAITAPASAPHMQREPPKPSQKPEAIRIDFGRHGLGQPPR